MKKILLLLLLLPFAASSQDLQNQWIWIDGSKISGENIEELGVVGIEDSLNWPIVRRRANSVVDNNGNFLLYGGRTYNARKNELWSYNPTTNNWTWKKGHIRNTLLSNTNQEFGIEDIRNQPKSRSNAQLWKDSAGDLWLFGGGYTVDAGFGNDMWKYKSDTNNWIKVNAGTQDSQGLYGTIGVASATNIPPATEFATTWTDNDGNLWMFGGCRPTHNDATEPSFTSYNTLWKFTISTGMWTWQSGSQEADQDGAYTVLGSESPLNMPSSRSNASGWVDAAGNLCFFSGMGHLGTYNDIWRYNPTTNLWHWTRGNYGEPSHVETIGTEHELNVPGASYLYKAMIWKDSAGNIWYYDGSDIDKIMWKYNPQTNNWAVKKTIIGHLPFFEDVNISSPLNNPSTRSEAAVWTSANDELYLYGGYTYNVEVDNLIKYNITTNEWVLVKRATTANYTFGSENSYEYQHIEGVGTINERVNPGMMGGASGSWTDSEGNMWMYGLNFNSGTDSFAKDLWKYHSSSKKWQWMNGILHSSAYYDFRGALGVEARTNNPIPRTGSMSWRDNEDNLYLFGGLNSASPEYNSDMWKYNKSTNMWVWIKGVSTFNSYGVYGQKGIPAVINNPGARRDATTWTDAAGNFYLFGGYGYAASGTWAGNLNDTWKYDVATNQWTWLSGPNTVGTSGYSAGIGVVDENNSPGGSPSKIPVWKRSDGSIWLYGGGLWKFEAGNWIQMQAYANLSYGIKGIFNATNSPGGRIFSSSWIDQDDNLILFGQKNNNTKMRDLWKYDFALGQWAWIGGKKHLFWGDNPSGNYGQKNEAFISNLPGGRTRQIFWQDNDFNFYIYGGFGHSSSSEGYLSDVWMSNRNFNTLAGNVKFGTGDCTASTINVPNVKINLASTSGDKITFTNSAGNYQEITDDEIVTITPQLEYYSFNPPSQTVNFSGFGSTQINTFCATPTQNVTDLDIIILPINAAIPGVDAHYKIVYKNKGTMSASGTITFAYNPSTSVYFSSTEVPQSQTANMISWNFSNLEPFEQRAHQVTFTINTPMATIPVIDGDVLTATAVINSTATDHTIEDNTFILNQIVVNSMDPNDKTCLEGASLEYTQIGEYVNYMIRFENTGTAEATNIVVTDMIDTSKFDMTSIQPVDASHAYRMIISDNNKLAFHMEGINLGFAPSNLRYGYVAFKIKTKSALQGGDTFSNLANIFFDYNYAIITNNYVTTFTENLSVSESNMATDLILYPNPVKNNLHLSSQFPITKIEIFDMAGRIILSSNSSANTVDLSRLKSGNYIVKSVVDGKVVTSKLIKE